VSISSGIYGRRLTAYSCGGSRGFVCLKQTHRIPLASPLGHYQSRNWHFIVTRVNNRIETTDASVQQIGEK
jgi:hypothetical protein